MLCAQALQAPELEALLALLAEYLEVRTPPGGAGRGAPLAPLAAELKDKLLQELSVTARLAANALWGMCAAPELHERARAWLCPAPAAAAGSSTGAAAPASGPPCDGGANVLPSYDTSALQVRCRAHHRA